MANGKEDKLDWLLRHLKLKKKPATATNVVADQQPDAVDKPVATTTTVTQPDAVVVAPELAQLRQELQSLLDQLKQDAINAGLGALNKPGSEAKGALAADDADLTVARQKLAGFKLAIKAVRLERDQWIAAKDDVDAARKDIEELTAKKDPEAKRLKDALDNAGGSATANFFARAVQEVAPVRQEAKSLVARYPGRSTWVGAAAQNSMVGILIGELTKLDAEKGAEWADKLKAVRAKAALHDYDNAATELKKLHDALLKSKTSPYGAALAAQLKQAEATVAEITKWHSAGKAGKPPPKIIADGYRSVTAHLAEAQQVMRLAQDDADFADVQVPMTELSKVIKGLEHNRQTADSWMVKDALTALTTRGQALRDGFVTKKLYGDPVPDEITAALKLFTKLESDFPGALAAAKKDLDIAAMQEALQQLEKALAATEEAAGRVATKQLKGGLMTSNKAVRKGIMDRFAQDPNALKVLASCGEGLKLLDELVAGIGTKAGPEEKDFIKQAVIAKYGLAKLEGQLGKKALPRLYKVLDKVPLTHTRDNPYFAEVKRDKAEGQKDGGETSNYQDKKVRLNLGSVDAGVANLDPDDEVPKKIRAKSSEANYFNHTTLHEIGHAVDDKLKFMDGKAGVDAFGGWAKLDGAGTVADAIGNDDGKAFGKFFSTFSAKIPKGALRACLVDILNGAAAAGKAQALLARATTPLTEQERRDLLAHPALGWCESVRMQGKGGLWDDGAKSRQHAIGGRIFQEAYAKDWYSYALAARNKGISSYQFRSPAEWFAELYAAHHLKVLPEGHPDHGWVSTIDPPRAKSKA